MACEAGCCYLGVGQAVIGHMGAAVTAAKGGQEGALKPMFLKIYRR